MSPTIIGFAWKTEVWCPRCLFDALDGLSTLPVRGDSAELAAAIMLHGMIDLKLEAYDPRWQDSTVIPQPVFSTDDISSECCRCGEGLE